MSSAQSCTIKTKYRGMMGRYAQILFPVHLSTKSNTPRIFLCELASLSVSSHDLSSHSGIHFVRRVSPSNCASLNDVLYVNECLPACMPVRQVSAWCSWRPEGGVRASGVPVVVSSRLWVLGTELGPSVRAGSAVNHGTNYLSGPKYAFYRLSTLELYPSFMIKF